MDARVVKLCLWKLGNYYSSNVDRNGGGYEVNAIRNALHNQFRESKEVELRTKASMYVYDKKSIILIVNGTPTKNDHSRLEFAKSKGAYLVFVWTDFDLYRDAYNISEMCDCVIGQGFPGNYYEGKPYFYNWIPELFYNPNLPVSEYKHEQCFFGGSLTGREEEIEQLLPYVTERYAKSFKRDMFILYKNENNDFRVSYDSYRNMLSLFRYAYVSGKDNGKEIGWVTARMVEAINADCVPIIVSGYDKYNHFEMEEFKVNSVSGLDMLMKEEELEEQLEAVEKCKDRIIENGLKFGLLINKIVEKRMKDEEI